MRYHTLILAAAFATASSQLPAQRIALDLRVVPAAPAQEFAGAKLNTGLGFGSTISFRFQEHLSLYGGWDWMKFRADQSFAGADMDFEETGYAFGLRFEHPLRDNSRIAYRLEAGGTYKHVEIENEDGDQVLDTGHDLGYEAAIGLVIPATSTWRFVTALRYRSLSNDFAQSGVTTNGHLRYAALEIGVSRRFW
jgi:hypothetical protein